MEKGFLLNQYINTRRIHGDGGGSDRLLNKWTVASWSPLTQRAPRARQPPPLLSLSGRQLAVSTWELLIRGS